MPPTAFAERKWQRDGASLWGCRRGCERPLGSGPRAQTGSRGRARARRRGPAEPPKSGKRDAARPTSFGAVVPVPWNRSVHLKVE